MKRVGTLRLFFFVTLITVAFSRSIKISNSDCVGWDCNPGIMTTISQRGLNYLLSIGVKMATEALNNKDIPCPPKSCSGEQKVPVLGHLKWDVSDIHISTFAIPSSVIIVKGGKIWITAKANFDLTLNWHYCERGFPHICGHGQASVQAQDVDISVGIAINAQNGEAQLAVDHLSLSIGNFKLTDHGGAAWLYNLLVSLFKSKIQDAIVSNLQDTLKGNIISQANKALSTLPTKEPLGHWVEIDLSLNEAPILDDGLLTTNHKGEVTPIAGGKQPQYAPNKMPRNVTSDQLQVFMNVFTPMTLIYSLQEAGQTQVNITNSMIPALSPLTLNTTSWLPVIPELAKKFPNKLMKLWVRTDGTDHPMQVWFTPHWGTALSGKGYITAFIEEAGEPVAFTVGVDVHLAARLDVTKSNRLSGRLSIVNVTLSIVETNVGPFHPNVIGEFINFIADKIVLPVANAFLSTGLPIPVVDGVVFKDPAILYGGDYLSIVTDIIYTPQ